jgi:hypothetical protein
MPARCAIPLGCLSWIKFIKIPLCVTATLKKGIVPKTIPEQKQIGSKSNHFVCSIQERDGLTYKETACEEQQSKSPSHPKHGMQLQVEPLVREGPA